MKKSLNVGVPDAMQCTHMYYDMYLRSDYFSILNDGLYDFNTK